MLRNDSAIARLSLLQTQLSDRKKQGGEPFQLVDFNPYATDRAVESDEEPTVEETVAGFMAVLGAKKNG